MEQKTLLLFVLGIGFLIIVSGLFLVPRNISYDPRPGLVARTLIDLDPNSNQMNLFAESITTDENGILYVGDNTGRILRIDPESPKIEVVGKVSTAGGEPTMLLGIKFDSEGNLYVATGKYGEIWKLNKESISASNPGEAAVFVSGLGFTNDIVFDKYGRMLVSDSQNGVLWAIDMETRGATQFGNQLTSRNPDIPFGINGMAIDTDGTIYFSNTGNGVIHKIETRKEDGGLMSITVWRSHEALVGIDGLAIDKAGNVWAAINSKNAIFAITKDDRRIIEVSKSDNSGPLEFPSSIAFSGESIFITNFDVPMGDNKDNESGIGPSIATIQLGVEGVAIPPKPLSFVEGR